MLKDELKHCPNELISIDVTLGKRTDEGSSIFIHCLCHACDKQISIVGQHAWKLGDITHRLLRTKDTPDDGQDIQLIGGTLNLNRYLSCTCGQGKFRPNSESLYLMYKIVDEEGTIYQVTFSLCCEGCSQYYMLRWKQFVKTGIILPSIEEGASHG